MTMLFPSCNVEKYVLKLNRIEGIFRFDESISL